MKKVIALLVIVIVIILMISSRINNNAPNYVDPHPDEDIASVNRR